MDIQKLFSASQYSFLHCKKHEKVYRRKVFQAYALALSNSGFYIFRTNLPRKKKQPGLSLILNYKCITQVLRVSTMWPKFNIYAVFYKCYSHSIDIFKKAETKSSPVVIYHIYLLN